MVQRILGTLALGAYPITGSNEPPYLHGKQVNPTVGNDKQDVNVWRAQVEYKF